jgi:hypothetical protein
MAEPLVIARDGVELGSLPATEVQALLQSGFLKLTDDYWQKGMTDWRPLSELQAPERVQKTEADWNLSRQARTAARGAAVLARRLKAVIENKAGAIAKTRERVLGDFIPQLRVLVTERLKQSSVDANDLLKNDEMMRKVFGAVFDCLPKPVLRFVSEEQFIAFCMRHRQRLVDDSKPR